MRKKDCMLFFFNNKTRRNCAPTTIIDRNRCLTMLTRPSSVSLLFTSSFFFQHTTPNIQTRIQNAKGQWHVRFHPFLFANQAASQSYSMLKAFSLSPSFCAFALILLPSSSSAFHIFFAFVTTISNHILCIAMLFFSFHEFIYFLSARFAPIKFKKNKKSLMSKKYNILSSSYSTKKYKKNNV